MLKRRLVRTLASSVMLLLALWIAMPKVYVHALLNHQHQPGNVAKETSIRTPSSDDCNFEKFDRPAYFNLFKFIGSFIPRPERGTDNVEQDLLRICASSISSLLLRGPPAI